MRSPGYETDLERLHSLSKVASYADLAKEAELIAEDSGRSLVERGTAYSLWGYSLLRLDPYKFREQAADIIQQGETILNTIRDEAPSVVDGALLTVGLSWQLLNKHVQAVAVFGSVLSKSDADLTHKVKAGFSRAFSLEAMGRQDDELATYRELVQLLDVVPEAAITNALRRDRTRIRLNMADYYLNLGQHQEAEGELNRINQETLTPLMLASKLVSQARIAMMRDQWVDAETLANRAYTAALEVNYAPLRVDALGVLVAVAARKNRREEQLRLVVEMASLAQAK